MRSDRDAAAPQSPDPGRYRTRRLRDHVQPASFDSYLERLEQLVNRAILALLASTFTIAAALLLAAYHSAHWDWVVEGLFLAVLWGAGGFGTYVLVLLLRSKHKRP